MALVACTGNDEVPPAMVPRLEATVCPDDVEILVVPVHSCGYVVTSGRSGAELRVFVVTVEPPQPSDLAPVLETGTDLGMTPTYGGLAPIAQRTGRRLVMVDLPGTGHSEPSLDCPETKDLALQPDDDEVAEAVGECRSRLEGDDVAIGDLTADALGEVLRDVITAFDVAPWVVMGHGTSGVAAQDLAAEHPDLVEALVLDSVVSHDPTPEETLGDVVAAVAEQCRAVPTCLSAHGDPARTWATAQERLGAAPLVVPVGDQTVTITAADLGRVLRWLVSPAVSGPQQLPELLAELASGHAGRLVSLYAGTVSAAPPLCVGYLPRCESSDRVATGAVLATVCPTVADQPDWSSACDAWGVGVRTVERTRVTGVPTLALYGRLDPFASPEVARSELARSFPEAYAVEVPTMGHNVLGDECVRTLRNTWLSGSFDAAPELPTCLSDTITFE
jgi:pimeloyl-ACP methyl ester carboxylesterase